MKTLKLYSAQWCSPCSQLKKTIDSNYDEIKVDSIIRMDVDASMEDAKVDGIRAVPTLILYEDGKEIARTTGAKTLDQLKQFIG